MFSLTWWTLQVCEATHNQLMAGTAHDAKETRDSFSRTSSSALFDVLIPTLAPDLLVPSPSPCYFCRTTLNTTRQINLGQPWSTPSEESTSWSKKSPMVAAVRPVHYPCRSFPLSNLHLIIVASSLIGSVFLGVHTIAGKSVAIKLEAAPPSSPNLLSPLKQESKIYKTLMGGPGVPWIMWSGRSGDYNVMVIDLLGPSLEDLFKMCNRHFTLKTVLMLADQLLERIAFIHSKDFVHRDVKPANFVMGTGPAAHLANVIDFGLAKKFRDSKTGAHIPYREEDCHGVGTSLFASINTHLGVGELEFVRSPGASINY